MRGNFRWPTILLLSIFLFAAGFRLMLLDRPFERDPEGCAAYYGILARNYFRYDLGTTFGVPVESGGQADIPVLYPNHPPLTPLLIAFVDGVAGFWGSYAIFTPDWAVRLPTALLTLACMHTLFLMLRNRAGPRAALLGAAIFALLPITLYYGGLADVISPQLVFFILLTIAAYLRFHETQSFQNLCLLCAAMIPAAMSDWPAFHIVPVLGLHYIVTRPIRAWGWIIAFGVFTVALFFVLYAHVALVVHDWTWMKKLVVRRSIGDVSDAGEVITLASWWHKAVWTLARSQFRLVILVLMALYVLTLPVVAIARKWGRADQLAILLLGWATVHILVGRQGVFVHDWWWWPLAPAAVVGTALLLDRGMSLLEAWGAKPGALNTAAVLALLAFGVWNVRDTLVTMAHPQRMTPGPLNYTTEELGLVIRASTAPNEAVMLADGDRSLPLWYYADRALIRNIWDPWAFDSRMHAGTIDGPFVDERDPWRGPIGALVIPRIYIDLPTVRQLTEQLAEFPRRETEKFIVIDLTPPG